MFERPCTHCRMYILSVGNYFRNLLRLHVASFRIYKQTRLIAVSLAIAPNGTLTAPRETFYIFRTLQKLSECEISTAGRSKHRGRSNIV